MNNRLIGNTNLNLEAIAFSRFYPYGTDKHPKGPVLDVWMQTGARYPATFKDREAVALWEEIKSHSIPIGVEPDTNQQAEEVF